MSRPLIPVQHCLLNCLDRMSSSALYPLTPVMGTKPGSNSGRFTEAKQIESLYTMWWLPKSLKTRRYIFTCWDMTTALLFYRNVFRITIGYQTMATIVIEKRTRAKRVHLFPPTKWTLLTPMCKAKAIFRKTKSSSLQVMRVECKLTQHKTKNP